MLSILYCKLNIHYFLIKCKYSVYMIMSLTNCFLKYLVILFCLMITKGVDLMDLNKWFDQGISKQAYKNTLTNHKEDFNHKYEHISFLYNNEYYLYIIKNQILLVLIIDILFFYNY